MLQLSALLQRSGWTSVTRGMLVYGWRAGTHHLSRALFRAKKAKAKTAGLR